MENTDFLRGLLMYKKILAHPCAGIISNFLIILCPYSIESVISHKNYKKMLKQYNSKICFKCGIYEEYVNQCVKCNKNFCFYYIVFGGLCIDCIEKCNTCGDYTGKKCFSCNKYICNKCYSLVKHMYIINQSVYFVCNVKCISVDFFRKQLIITLKKRHRQDKLKKYLNMYNLSLQSIDGLCSELCVSYMSEKLDKKFWTAERVAQKICEIHCLYEFCNLEYYLDTLNYHAIEEFRYECFEDSPKFKLAKLKALQHKGGSFTIDWFSNTKVKEEHRTKMNKLIEEIQLTPPNGIKYLHLLNNWNGAVHT